MAGILLGCYAAAIAVIPGLQAKSLLCAPLIVIPFGWWVLNDSRRWLIAFFLAAWLLPPLPIALGNSGPHVAVLFAAAGLWLAVIRLPEWRFEATLLAVALSALFAALTLSLSQAAINSGLSLAAASMARVLLFGISVFVFFFVSSGPVIEPRPIIRTLFWTAVVSALFACVDFYFQFPAPAGYGPQFIWLDSGVFRRAQGLFYEASTLGNFCAFFLVMIGVALVRNRELSIFPLWALLSGAIVFSAALIFSYSRASLINVLVAAFMLAWLERKRLRFSRVAIALLIGVVVGASVLISIFPEFTSAYLLRISSSAQFFLESPNGVLSGRIQSWTLLKDVLLSHPWYALLGVGYKTLPYSDFLGSTTVADNTYLSMLIETGIGGLVALFALHVAVFRTAYRAAMAVDGTRSFLGAWILCFWSGQIVQMLSGDLLTYWRVLPAYFCILGMAARAGR
jgi:O-antigen ligase